MLPGGGFFLEERRLCFFGVLFFGVDVPSMPAFGSVTMKRCRRNERAFYRSSHWDILTNDQNHDGYNFYRRRDTTPYVRINRAANSDNFQGLAKLSANPKLERGCATSASASSS